MSAKTIKNLEDRTSFRRDAGQTHLCRICEGETFMLLNLRHHPFANALVDSTLVPIKIYPLALLICKRCSSAQLSYCADDHELYDTYNYITPDSQELREHYGQIVSFLQNNRYLPATANVLEIGSNIGKFLEFLKPQVNSVLGVDPAKNIAKMANEGGIPTINDFFNIASAEKVLKESGKKDMVIARHCFAHNEKPWLMLDGVKTILSPRGVLVIENAYFLDTVKHQEFDQIYHEHMYYYNLRSIREMLTRNGFELVDVFHGHIHGGTMLYVAQLQSSNLSVSGRVREYLGKEKNMHKKEFYRDFIDGLKENKQKLKQLLESLSF
ncbi:MAG: methyltransferase domain-containing protein [Candidatus Omnitrophota bacterium]|nr:methyltransferase domain-containing protein [Candidatus Omnitrophota bacterium]